MDFSSFIVGFNTQKAQDFIFRKGLPRKSCVIINRPEVLLSHKLMVPTHVYVLEDSFKIRGIDAILEYMEQLAKKNPLMVYEKEIGPM